MILANKPMIMNAKIALALNPHKKHASALTPIHMMKRLTFVMFVIVRGDSITTLIDNSSRK